MVDFLLGQFTALNHKWFGYALLAIAIIAILSLDKIIQAVIWLMDWTNELKNRNK